MNDRLIIYFLYFFKFGCIRVELFISMFIFEGIRFVINFKSFFFIILVYFKILFCIFI